MQCDLCGCELNEHAFVFSPVVFRAAVTFGLRPLAFSAEVSAPGEYASAAERWASAALEETSDWTVCPACEPRIQTVLVSPGESHGSTLLLAAFFAISCFLVDRYMGLGDARWVVWVCGAVVALVLGAKTLALHQTNRLRSRGSKLLASDPPRHIFVGLPPSVSEGQRSQFAARTQALAGELNSWKSADGPQALKKITDAAEDVGREIYAVGGKALIVRMLSESKAGGLYVGALEKEWEAFFY
jgi:hypothetical protein